MPTCTSLSSCTPAPSSGARAEAALRRLDGLAEHVLCQHAGLRVVARAMVAIDQPEPVRQRMHAAMAEPEGRGSAADRCHDRVVRHAAEGEDRLEPRQATGLALEKPASGERLRRRRLVLWGT